MNTELSKMMELYDVLSLNDKRNEFSLLLSKSNEIINTLLKMEQIENDLNIKNYNSSSDSKMTEDEMLTFLYEDMWNIKNKLLTLLIFKSNS